MRKKIQFEVLTLNKLSAMFQHPKSATLELGLGVGGGDWTKIRLFLMNVKYPFTNSYEQSFCS
jgi:hypothetical protein